jgi:hypothetical protein
MSEGDESLLSKVCALLACLAILKLDEVTLDRGDRAKRFVRSAWRR